MSDSSNGSQQYTSPPSVVSRTVGGETVLVDLDGERYFSVNETGSLIWAELSAGRSTSEALARQDLDELVAALVEAGLLIPGS
jgi:hypothetical protein